MFRQVSDFTRVWKHVSADTLRLFQNLTDASLSKAIAPDHRTIGRIAWHITTTIPELMGKAGVHLSKVREDDPIPPSADAIRKLYDLVSKELLTKLPSAWTDADLEKTDDMYGMKWQRGESLMILVQHESHHRGQLTVLMRQAGLQVAGVYGPSYEEWAGMGMKPPAI